MTQIHSLLNSPAEIHEAKQIAGGVTTDSGKVITPSAVTNGIGELRYLSRKDLALRVVGLVDAATIASNSDTTDIGAVTITASRTLGAPSGTPVSGQELIFSIAQDGTGGRVLTFDPVFTFQGSLPAPDLTPNTVALYSFRWNTAQAKWNQFIKPVGGAVYTGKTIKNNTTVIACPAMTDPVNFSTVADWRQITGVFESPEVAPSKAFTRGTNDLTVLVTGIYHAEATLTGENNVNNTIVGVTFGINGVALVDRNVQADFGGLGTRRHLSAHAYIPLVAGQVVTAWTAASAASNVMFRQGRFSLTLVDRTA